MRQLLVIERSSTLGHLLRRTLRAGGFSSIARADSYEDGLWLLREAVEGSGGYAAVLIGAPSRPTADHDAVMDYLAGGPGLSIPVLLMTHERTDAQEKWINGRPNSQLLLWSEFGKIPACVRGVIRPGDGRGEDKSSVAARGPAVAAEEEDAGRGIRVLFVDDSQSVRLAYRRLLEREGFDVVLAEDVAGAVKQAKQGGIDLAILDYFLPDGTGDEICRRLKENPATSGIACTIITGTYRESLIKKCLEAGAIECMFKDEAQELFSARVNAICRTIESQKFVEAERRRLDGILGSVGDGVYGVDGEGTITFINPNGARMLGYGDDHDLVGRSAHDLFHYATEEGQARPIAECPLHQTYTKGDSLNGYETVFFRYDKEPVPVECNVVPLDIDSKRQGSVVVFRDISERKSAERLRWEASHDPMTGLHNQRHFMDALGQQLNRIKDRGGYAAVLYVDLDRFGHVTEAAGERVAEQLLSDVGSRLSTLLRGRDIIAHLDEDKFALLLCDVQLENIFSIADQFREGLLQCHYQVQNERRSLAGSIGVALLNHETPSAEVAMEHSRVACRMAKKKGRNQTHIYVSDTDARISRELEAGWSDRFREALRNDRFELLIQPIVSVGQLSENANKRGDPEHLGSRMAGPDPDEGYLFELLLRMVSRKDELISPHVFVPLAERVHMMQEIDLWVVRNVLGYLSKVADLPVRLTINLSNLTLQDPEALPLLTSLLESHDVDPSRIVFEITETSAIGNVNTARRFIQALKRIGVRFALDDFGTGFSSFSHLKHLPVDFIKIDGMFVETMTESDIDHTMVKSINDIAHSLKLRTIAEHVDRNDTLRAVARCGVDFVQGNYLGEPVSIKDVDFHALIQKQKKAEQA